MQEQNTKDTKWVLSNIPVGLLREFGETTRDLRQKHSRPVAIYHWLWNVSKHPKFTAAGVCLVRVGHEDEVERKGWNDW